MLDIRGLCMDERRWNDTLAVRLSLLVANSARQQPIEVQASVHSHEFFSVDATRFAVTTPERYYSKTLNILPVAIAATVLPGQKHRDVR